MENQLLRYSILWVVLWFGAILALPTHAQTPAMDVPVKNDAMPDSLLIAFNVEISLHHRYIAYAQKADAEGFTGVGSLFRALAKAEEIHAIHLTRLIKSVTGTAPIPKPIKYSVKSTHENLLAALKEESQEKDVIYPEIMKHARIFFDKIAMRDFASFMSADAGHARLLRSALNRLDSMRSGTLTFQVCALCGNTLPKIQFDFLKCPICALTSERFLKII